MDHLKNFLFMLSNSQPARDITLPGSLDNLSGELRKFGNEVTPPTLGPRWSLLLDKVDSRAPELDIWTTVVELLKEFDGPTVITTEDSVSTTTDAVDSRIVKYLKKDWKSTFIPDSLMALRNVISDFDEKLEAKDNKFYARTLVFIQSSGMGKSRLADAYGRRCPMINYVLREERTYGYPPADHEILSLMRMQLSDNQKNIFTSSPNSKSSDKAYTKSRMDITWYHSLAVGLLQASFETLNDWVENQSTLMTLGELADLRRKAMAHSSRSNQPLEYRPKKRIEFCQLVAERAKKIASKLVKKPSWRRVFGNREGSAIRHELVRKEANHLKGLQEAVQKLLDNLNRFQRRKVRGPPLVVVFDEASSLLETDKSGRIHSGRYIALNRIMSCLKESPIWFFIMSTAAQVGTILPLNNAWGTGDFAEDPSLRFIIKSTVQLKRIPPFLALRLDIEDRDAMQNSTKIQNELHKSLSNFGELSHMAMFGRRLWFAYSNDPKEMNKVAKAKLIGGVQRGSYNPSDKNHVFAALSFRLSLDPCMHNSKTLPLIGTAVNSHMRVVISIDEEAGTMHTITPSEPIIAKAAMEYLCDGHNWATSIDTLVRQLLEKGLVEKGLKGELYARLLLVLAHDCVRLGRGQVDESNREPQESESISSPKFMKPFTVKDFLEALYVTGCHEYINRVDPKILGARMNFTHFIPTHENLSPEVLPDLLSDLLRRSAALQLAPCQPTYDILLPIYFGEENEPLDPSKCGCVMIQVKNRDAATTPKAIFQEEFTTVDEERKASNVPANPSTSRKKAKVPIRNGLKFVFNEMTNPILFLLFDLGIARTNRAIAPHVEVSYSSNKKDSPRVWAIHSRGHDGNVFRCLKLMNCEESSKAFFTITVSGVNMHDTLARSNELFYKLHRDFRYPPLEGKGDVLMEDEGDVLMEDEVDTPMEDEVDTPMEDEGDASMEDEGDTE